MSEACAAALEELFVEGPPASPVAPEDEMGVEPSESSAAPALAWGQPRVLGGVPEPAFEKTGFSLNMPAPGGAPAKRGRGGSSPVLRTTTLFFIR